MSNPFAISGPASISFSGGRTSAYMLWRILDAHGGALPSDVIVTFANTGREREETLRFVYECGVRWSVEIVWLEWRKAAPGFERVGFNSASRNGEPFEALIRLKQRLPNWRERWCTGFLKVLTMHAYNQSLGREKGQFLEVIGLRHDEGARILTGRANASRDKRSVVYPLAAAGLRKTDVMTFWRAQPFNLALQPHEGNCDLCFLKGRALRQRIIRDTPEAAEWWRRMEAEQSGFFDRRDRVADLVEAVRSSPELLDIVAEIEERDAECGDLCGGDSLAELAAMQRIYEGLRASETDEQLDLLDWLNGVAV